MLALLEEGMKTLTLEAYWRLAMGTAEAVELAATEEELGVMEALEMGVKENWRLLRLSRIRGVTEAPGTTDEELGVMEALEEGV